MDEPVSTHINQEKLMVLQYLPGYGYTTTVVGTKASATWIHSGCQATAILPSTLSQLLAVHGRISSSALVHRQMITAMFAGILASSAPLLMPARSTVAFETPALLGIARQLCALGSFTMLTIAQPRSSGAS
ncbi:uncharacterized protein TrAtP1_006404 [Trichoderma atroviride]|uniref:uncharacterized protein n=1 Tax=Hypocrea atroviridis TaxID=63577 RepID=UPI00332838E2|nr:hypothetical protein TrAtP1_006404 [Trichoderma atroviride]